MISVQTQTPCLCSIPYTADCLSMLQLIFNYLYSLCFPFSAVCQIYLFRFAGILNRFIWNLREIITTTNRSNDYVFGQSWNRKEQGSTVRDKTQIDINRFSRHVKQVLPPSKWIHKFMAQTREDAIMDTVSRQFTDFTYKFRIKISRIFSYLSTIDIGHWISYGNAPMEQKQVYTSVTCMCV